MRTSVYLINYIPGLCLLNYYIISPNYHYLFQVFYCNRSTNWFCHKFSNLNSAIPVSNLFPSLKMVYKSIIKQLIQNSTLKSHNVMPPKSPQNRHLSHESFFTNFVDDSNWKQETLYPFTTVPRSQSRK